MNKFRTSNSKLVYFLQNNILTKKRQYTLVVIHNINVSIYQIIYNNHFNYLVIIFVPYFNIAKQGTIHYLMKKTI